MTTITEATADRVWHGGILGEPVTLLLRQTCYACPEQYDVFSPGGVQVGYLRLRHGYFSAEMSDAGDETVYEGRPRGDGIFEDDAERDEHLNAACEVIARHVRIARRLTAPAPGEGEQG